MKPHEIANKEELIKTLRWCGGENNEWCVGETYKCPLWNEDRITDDCKAELMTTAADALESKSKAVIPHRNYENCHIYWCDCGWFLRDKEQTPNYCPNCGKRIEWGRRRMTNAEIIKALRDNEECNDCAIAIHDDCNDRKVRFAAAYALEVADEKIADYTAAIDALDDSNDAYIKENERLKKRIAKLEEDIIYWQTYALEIKRRHDD